MMLQKYKNYIKPKSYTNILIKFLFNTPKIPHFCTELLIPYFMRLHRPVLNNIISALNKIINENFYTDKVLEYIFKTNKQLGKRDRQLIAETTYNIVRYYYYYQYLSKSTDLRKIIHTYFIKNNIPIDNLSISKISIDEKKEIPDRIKYSYNESLWEEGIQQLGKEKWIKEASALNESAALVIRTNTLKISRDELQKKLLNIGIETKKVDDVPEALIITNKSYLSQNDLFKAGYYEFQDVSSQKVAHFIPKEILPSAKRIIDACAGAGGKTLHLSALMQNKGQIIAMDVEEKKLRELKKRSARAGCSNIQIKLINSSKTIKRLSHSADVVLIDAPCSGTGVIKRNPDTKLKFNKENYSELIAIQQQILNDYSTMVKDNAYLLYVTCSILPEENEHQVRKFLNQHSEFSLVKEQTLYPSDGFDGFYMALLQKKKQS